MKISIIIVNYNTVGLLETCIDSVCSFEKDIEKEFIIVDNNSDDKSIADIKLLSEKNRNVKSVFLDSNKGFAYANNRGVDICEGDYVLILNPDITFTESILNKLLNYSIDKTTGALGVRLYGEDGKFQKKYYQKYPSVWQYLLFYSVFSKPFIKSERLIKKYLESNVSENNKGLKEVPQIPGAFIFMKKSIYNEFNGFNESYFLFFEDVDLCYRIAKIYKLYLTDFKVKHIGASSMMLDTNYKIYGYFIISFIVFFKNNYTKSRYSIIKSIIRINSVLKILMEIFKKIYNDSKPNIIKVHKYILKNL